jgi:hypothetical protein
MSTSDYPVKKTDLDSWKKVFINQGDVMMVQIVAAHSGDRELFDYVTSGTGYEQKRCIALIQQIADADWSGLQSWVQCYANNGKQPRRCSSYLYKLSQQVNGIEKVLGEPSGFCRD